MTLSGSGAGGITLGAAISDSPNGGKTALAISGSGGGVVTLSGANTYTGSTTISGGNAVGLTGTLAGTSINNSGLFTENSGALISGSGVTFANTAGLSTLSGSNTYTGGTTLTTGTVQLGNSFALGAGPVTVNGGLLDLHGNNLSITGTFSGTGGTVDNLSASPVNLTIGPTLVSSTYSGVIQNSNGAISIVTGVAAGTVASTTTLTNAFYTGNTTVDADSTLNIAGSFGSPTATIAVGTVGGATAAGTMTILSGTATAGAVSVATAANETGSILNINGSTVTHFSTSNFGGNSSGWAVVITSTGAVNLGVVTVDRDGFGATTTGSNGLVINNPGANVTATNLIDGSDLAGRNSEIDLDAGSLTITGATGGLVIGSGTSVGPASFTVTSGTLTYSGTDGMQVSANAASTTDIGIVTINGGVSNLSGIVLNPGSALATSGLTSEFILNAGSLYLGGSTNPGGALVINNPGATIFAHFGNATVGATTAWSTTAPIVLTGTQANPVTTFQAADSLGNGNNITLGGALSGTGGLIATGAGIVDLTAVNTYSGNTAVGVGGTLEIGGAGQLGSGAYVGTLANAGNFIYDSSAVQTLSGAVSGTGALTVEYGTLTLSASNTYTGLTTVSGGTLVAANNAALGNATAPGGGLSMNPASGTAIADFISAAPSIASLSSSGAGTSDIVLGNSGSSSATSLTVGGNGLASTFAGVISDQPAGNTSAIGSLTKSGTGNLTLSGVSTYTGATTVSQGRLIVSGSITGSASASIATTAHLEVDGSFNNATAISVTGFLNGTGTVGPVTVQSNGTLGPAHDLGVTAAGTLTANGAVAFTDTSSIFSIRLGVASGNDNDQLDVGSDRYDQPQ